MDTDGASTGEHQERAGEIVLSHITAGENADSTTNSKRKRKPTLKPRINHIPNISNADKERILKMQRNSNQQDAHATASSKTTPPTRIANTDGGLFVDSDEEDPESEWKEVNNVGDFRQKIDEEWDFLGENEADGTAMGPKHAASGLKGKPKRKSQAEMNALQPRLSKDTPCNKTDEELRAIAKLPRGRARHDAAPYAFDGETVLTEEELKKLMDNVPKKLRAIQQPDIFNSKAEVRQRKRKNYLDQHDKSTGKYLSPVYAPVERQMSTMNQHAAQQSVLKDSTKLTAEDLDVDQVTKSRRELHNAATSDG